MLNGKKNGTDNMTKKDMVDFVAADAGVSKKTTQKVIDSYNSSIVSIARSGGYITISKFGTFQGVVRAARSGVNPQTGKKMKIPKKKVMKFTPSKTIKF